MVGEMIARNDLIVLNQGREFTFRRGAVVSSYRPIRLLDTIGKLLKELILRRLQALLVGNNGLSENQFRFRKGRSAVDAIQAVVNIATNARKGTG